MPLIPRRIGALLLLCGACLAQAERLQVAVAANFKEPLQRLVAEFDRATGHETQLSLGATGALYARISHGAPYDVFLSADTLRVQRLELDGVAVAGTRFTYATGRLALWSARADGVDAQGEVLKRGNFKRLALASPQLAPYGAAAVQVLAALGVRESAAHPWIRGESIGQTYAFVASGNVDLGLVALSQVMENGRIKSGSAWIVPASLHPPMRQDAVLLAHGKDNRAARALLAYLRTPQAQSVIQSYGYDTEAGAAP